MQVRAALELWNGQGTFVFTGSAGIYTTDDGGRVTEESPVSQLGKDERTDRSATIHILCLDPMPFRV